MGDIAFYFCQEAVIDDLHKKSLANSVKHQWIHVDSLVKQYIEGKLHLSSPHMLQLVRNLKSTLPNVNGFIETSIKQANNSEAYQQSKLEFAPSIQVNWFSHVNLIKRSLFLSHLIQ